MGRGDRRSRKGKIFSRHAREIMLAAKTGGGDTSTNTRLRLCMDKARGDGIPVGGLRADVESVGCPGLHLTHAPGEMGDDPDGGRDPGFLEDLGDQVDTDPGGLAGDRPRKGFLFGDNEVQGLGTDHAGEHQGSPENQPAESPPSFQECLPAPRPPASFIHGKSVFKEEAGLSTGAGVFPENRTTTARSG